MQQGCTWEVDASGWLCTMLVKRCTSASRNDATGEPPTPPMPKDTSPRKLGSCSSNPSGGLQTACTSSRDCSQLLLGLMCIRRLWP